LKRRVVEKVETSRSPEETVALAEALAAEEPPLPHYYLEGELGAGKTLFAKGVARHYGVDPSLVVSPTFSLVNRYGGGRRVIYHLDLYRIESERELRELGIEELEQEDSVLVVEWAEKMGSYRRRDAISVRIEVLGEDERRLTIRRPEAEEETRG
jgi:tRNA threonylcarbamoyladenosine biosynthesis protein TsaE